MHSLDPARTACELRELRSLTGSENGAQRVAFAPTWLKARDWLRERCAGLPIEMHDDAAGNFGTKPPNGGALLKCTLSVCRGCCVPTGKFRVWNGKHRRL
jgi:hypothetical protein